VTTEIPKYLILKSISKLSLGPLVIIFSFNQRIMGKTAGKREHVIEWSSVKALDE
jgi:hypothetical protein